MYFVQFYQTYMLSYACIEVFFSIYRYYLCEIKHTGTQAFIHAKVKGRAFLSAYIFSVVLIYVEFIFVVIDSMQQFKSLIFIFKPEYLFAKHNVVAIFNNNKYF